ncbi:MAG: GNAT family N-acetyltransferase [Marinibacterium sp.]|nr:GNAT family N-acetyltransferase [Marinibacterium sp.]
MSMLTQDDMARTHCAAFVLSRPWDASEFASLLDGPGCFASGTPACFALVRVIADEAELLTIATHPDHQGRGLARALMPRWQDIAAARGARHAFLEVAADNAPAIALYLGAGYRDLGLRRGYYARETGPSVDARIMGRDLPG